MKTLLALLLTLILPAQAILTVDSISGNENSLHAEFSISWLNNGTTQTVSGSWDGGNWEFLSLNSPINPTYDEGITQFYLRNIWSDGWNPGPVWQLLWVSSQTYSFTDYQFPLSNRNLADPVTFDYANTGLQYHLDASLFGDFSTHTTGGAARLVFDLERTPLASRDSGPYLPQESVPEGGSTMLLFSPVLLLLLWRRRATPHKLFKC